MKKRIAVFVVLCCAFTACLESISEEQRTIRKVYEIKMRKDKIYDGALEYIARTFVSGKSVLEMQNKAGGKIIGRGATKFRSGFVLLPVDYTMIIEIKDNRFRVTFENIVINYTPPMPMRIMAEYEQIAPDLLTLADGLYDYLAKGAKASDW